LKGVIRFSLNNKFALWIMTIIVIVAGLYSGFNMKMEMLPDINVPVLTVNTIYPGAAPEEIVEKVTEPLERRVRNLNGVTGVSSTSMENFSSIVIEYNYKKDMTEAANEAKEALSNISMPEGAQKPDVSRISLNMIPALSLSVTGDGMSLEDLSKVVENHVLPELQGLDGVASVQLSGQHVREALLTFDTAKMQSLGLSESTVRGIIQGSAIKVPLGLFELDHTDKSVIVDGNLISLDDLKALSIPVIPNVPMTGAPGGMSAGTPNMAQGSLPGAVPETAAPATPPPAIGGLPTVQLSDIATIEVVGHASSISRTNGMDSIGILVTKAADANTVDVVNRIKDHLTELEKQSPGLAITTIFDQGKPIEQSVNTMLSKAMLGSLFAIIIIMLFLRNIRSTLIAVVSIPLSILIAMLVLHQMDISLNIMTLGAMTVAIGRVVDDSIVVIENVYRRLSLSTEQLKGKELVLAATREMFIPISSSTIVTIAVFLPLGLVSGPIGEIFLPFALTIVFALLASLLVAITIVPMLAHLFFRKGLKNKHDHEDKPGKMAAFYKRTLNWSLNHKLITFGGAIVLLLGSFLLTPLIGFSFIPEEEEKSLIATYNPAPGERLEDVHELTGKAETLFLARNGVTSIQYSLGGSNPMNPGASKQALFFINYKNDIANFSEEKAAAIEALQQLGGNGEWKEQNFGGGGLGGSGMNVLVYGSNMQELRPVVAEVMEVMAKHDSLKNISSSISDTYEQYRLVADQAALSKYGLTAGQIAMELMPARQRTVLTTIEVEGKEVSVYLNVNKAVFTDKASIENTTISSPLGISVVLKDVVSIKEETSPDTISRRDDRMYAQVSADVEASNVSKVSSELQKAVEKLNLPANVTVEFGGVTEQMNDTFRQLGLAIMAAIAVVYLVLVITFKGGLTPFSILFSLPFTIIGGLLALLIAGETISVTALIGALMLIGIVVTNAIVLIDRVIRKEAEGLSVREALLEAAGTRLRPILMTALATIGALLPLAFGFESSGALISKGLGVTVVGGLTSSTLLTLIIVPIVYEFFHRFRRKDAEADV